MRRNFLWLFFIPGFFVPGILLAQAPTWSVEPSDYDNSMVITAVLHIQGSESRDTNDMVGAFINGELRGVAKPDTYLSGQDRYMAQLIVYSNNSSESITFKLYDNSTNTVLDAVTLPVTFVADGVIGGFDEPLLITDNNLPTDIQLSKNTVAENQASGITIGTFSTTDIDNDTFSYSLVNGDGDTDNASFSISTDQLKTAISFDYESQKIYNIRVQTTDSKGGTYEEIITINVTDSNDSPTDITLSTNNFLESNEIGSVVGILSTTDEDDSDTHSYEIVGGDMSNFSVNSNEIISTTSFNFENKSSYNIRVKTTDQAGSSFEKDIQIIIVNVNDAPTDMVLNPASVAENEPSGSLVGTLSTTDEDSGDTFTYSFVSGTEQNDNTQFIIIGDEVKTLKTFDYENRQLYYLNIKVTDAAGATYIELFTVQITEANDAPTGLELTSTEIEENLVAGSEVATFITTDPDNTDTHTYALISGTGSTDNDQFIIAGNKLLTATSFDYESTQLYKIRVQTTDNGSIPKSFEQTFVITVADANDTPENLQLSFNQIAEDASIGSVIGSFSVSDQDEDDTHQYSLVAGTGSTDNVSFAIVYGELRNLVSFDYETKDSYSIRVKAKDVDGATVEQQFTINITNSNDVPELIEIDNNIIGETTPVNTKVGTLTTTDADAGNTFSYKLSGTGNDNNKFVIIGDALLTSSTFDYETQAFYFINVTSKDNNGAEVSEQLVIIINDENDDPTDISLSNNKIGENEPVNVVIGKLFTEDQDDSDSFTYTLISGLNDDDNSLFTIIDNELQTDAIFDYETKNEFIIRVRTTDSDNSYFDKNFIIYATDRNDLPVSLDINKKSLNESDPIGTIVGKFISTDPDENDSKTYALVSGSNDADNAKFLVSGDELLLNTQADFEVKSFYNIRLAVIDKDGGTLEKAFILEVKDSNDAPTKLELKDNIITENLPVSSTVGTLVTTDPDATENFVYTLLPDFDAAKFYIEGDLLKANEVFDYETKSVYTLKIQVEDKEGITLLRNFAIVVKDTNDIPSDLNLSNQIIAENLPEGNLVGVISTVDSDVQDTYTYKLVEGINAEGNSSFQISGDKLLTATSFNYENQSTYSIRLKTTDNDGSSFEKVFTISIEDANDTPEGISITNNKIEENAAVGTLVGILSTEDQDTEDAHTYTIVSGTGDSGNTSFSIEDNKLVTNEIFDFESINEYSIVIQSTDKDGESFKKQFVISIINKNEAPVLNDITFRINEESSKDVLVGIMEAEDQNASAILTYSIVYENNEDELLEPFYINEQTGELLVNNPKLLDYETTQVFFIKVKVNNNGLGNLSDTAKVTIRLIDIIENTELPVNNYVSPNGDNINDTWEIQNVDLYSDYELMIFNDAGEIIFKTKNYQNDWGGDYNGNLLPSGVYYYSMRNPDSEISYKGSITLVR